jgi:glycosyltransferase involved in cell wall biosynthesis
MTLSVVIIARNEAAVIARCIDSVRFADEIILLDSGSDDGTPDIARERNVRVEVNRDWAGFGIQKNRALAFAGGDWVLSLDADEWVTPVLRAAIETAVRAPGTCTAFRMPRSSTFCGQAMRHSGWWPDYVTRLFRRGGARFSEDLVHERLITDGPVGRLDAPLMHEAVRTLEQAIRKMDTYSTAGAEMLAGRGRRASLWTALGHGLWAFVRTYFLRAGFLDGRAGFMLAVANAEGVYYRYLKLALRQT